MRRKLLSLLIIAALLLTMITPAFADVTTLGFDQHMTRFNNDMSEAAELAPSGYSNKGISCSQPLILNGTQLTAGKSWQGKSLVCCLEDGRPILPSSLSSMFRTLARRVGLEISFHGLRHGHATQLIENGIQANAVRDQLGHSNVGITLDTYAHVTKKQRKEIALMMNDILSSGLGQK